MPPLSLILEYVFSGYKTRAGMHFRGNSRTFIYIFLLSASVSVVCFAYFFLNDQTLIYNDARSHLNIARRVIDSLTPGFAQLGSVWLPLPHLLMIPFIWNDYLWRSGVAGSLVSMLSFVMGSIYIYFAVRTITKNDMLALFPALIFIVNPSILYLQSVPLTESLFVGFFTAFLYYILKWHGTSNYLYFIGAAFFVMLSTLVRYDGYFVLAVTTLFVAVRGYRRNGLSRGEGDAIFFATLGSIGVVLWLLYNQLIFGNAFYFGLSRYSAKAQQQIISDAGALPTKSDLWLSAYHFFGAVVDNLGLIPVLLLIGAAWYCIVRNSKHAVILLVAAAPVVFNIFTLYAGVSVIGSSFINSASVFNVRYGIVALPLLSIVFALFITHHTKTGKALCGAVLACYVLLAIPGNLPILRDGLDGSSAYSPVADLESRIVSTIYDGGYVLASAASMDPIILQAGPSMGKFIHEGTRVYWKTSLVNPSKYARYIMMRRGDDVYKALHNNKKRLHGFEEIYSNKNGFYIYRATKNKKIVINPNGRL